MGAVFSGTGDICGSVCFREDPEKVIFIYLYNYRDWYNGSPKIQLLAKFLKIKFLCTYLFMYVCMYVMCLFLFIVYVFYLLLVAVDILVVSPVLAFQ